MIPSQEQIMAREWLVKNRKRMRTCPDGTKISIQACDKRLHQLPHEWLERGVPTPNHHFLPCRECKHYYKPASTEAETLAKKRKNWTRPKQDRIDAAMKRRRNAKGNLQQSKHVPSMPKEVFLPGSDES